LCFGCQAEQDYAGAQKQDSFHHIKSVSKHVNV
jgi:hypothetical protein